MVAAHTDINAFLAKLDEGVELTNDLLDLGFGSHDFSIKDGDYDDEDEEEEEFRDELCDLFSPHEMSVGEISVKGEVSVECIHQQERQGEDGSERVQYFVVHFDCEPLLIAIWSTEFDGSWINEFTRLISTAGVQSLSDTGYLDEMIMDLRQAAGD